MDSIYFLLTIFVSCILQGITGFGFAVLAAPLGLLFFNQPTVTVILAIIGLVLNGYLALKIQTKADSKIVRQLIISGLIGVPFGVLALTSVNPNFLKLMAGTLALFFALILTFPKAKLKKRTKLTLALGSLTGFLQSSTGLSGPPIALMLLGYGLEPKKMRKTLALVFLVLNVFTLPLFFWKNVLTWPRLSLGILALPAVIIGGMVGDKISNHVSKNLVKWGTLILVILASAQVIYSVFR